MTTEQAATRRRRPARAAAIVLAILLVALVVVLATRDPASTRVARSPLVGREAPAIDGETIDGTAVSLEDLRGRWVLVNFFATWCGPCREEHDDLVRFSQRHLQVDDARVLGVVYDDSVDAVRAFRREEGGDWPMVVDDGGEIAVSYGVAGVPESYLVDPRGIVRAKILGGILDGELEDLLLRAQGGG